MARFLRHNEIVALVWEERFEPILKQLDDRFQGGSSHRLICSMRAILLLLKEDKRPTATQVLARICEEDEASPQGPRAAYDEVSWFYSLAEAEDALAAADPLKAVEGF